MTPKAKVEIRQGRHGLELRVDGTLASLHSQGAATKGPVWWALAAPMLLLPRTRRRRVLLLGLGGGTAAQVTRSLDPEAELVGVELNPEVIRLAKRHLGLDDLDIELVVDDALRHLTRERRKFDLIVEDLFIGRSQSVRKPPGLLDEGYRLIAKRLRPSGFVSSNTIHEAPAVTRAMHPLGKELLSLEVRGHWNRILICGRRVPGARELRRLLGAHGGFDRILPQLSVRSRRT